jgi:capsid protein
VLVRLFEFDHYEDAELVRKEAAALTGGFIIDNTPERPPRRDLGRDVANQLLMGLEPGTFPLLRPGQDVKFSTPADVGDT